MFEKIRKLPAIEILIAVASTIFGILIGPLLEKLISPFIATSTGVLVAGFVLFSILALISIVLIGIFARRHERDFEKLNVELSSINRRLGLTVRFVHDPPRHSAGEVYRVAREIIEKAEKEIVVLYFARQRDKAEEQRGRNLETEEYRNERKKYSQAILDKVKQHRNDKFFYRRVIQFPEGRETKFTEARLGKRWFEQAQAIVELLNDYKEAAYIKKASVFLEQTFVIVDERYVIWGIDSIDPEHEVQYMEGALFFDDPHQEFVRYLKSFFQRVDAHGVIVRKVPEV